MKPWIARMKDLSPAQYLELMKKKGEGRAFRNMRARHQKHRASEAQRALQD